MKPARMEIIEIGAVMLPEGFEQHLNLKQVFAGLENIKPCGMKGALRRLEIPLEGRHHRAIDDARNIARIARIVLSRLYTQL